MAILIISTIIILLMPAAVALFLLSAKNKSQRLANEEKGVKPLYQEQAGGRFNFVNWSIPFVRVAAYDSFAVIVYWNRVIVLRRGDVDSITTIDRVISRGLLIGHHRTNIPIKIIIWPRNLEVMRQALERCFL